ncbi:MAG: tetratricopeptide repeat protein [Isosphaeraceae bacterium]
MRRASTAGRRRTTRKWVGIAVAGTVIAAIGGGSPGAFPQDGTKSGTPPSTKSAGAAPAEPRTAAEYEARAKQRLARKDYRDATEDLDRAIALEPRRAALYVARAQVWAARFHTDMEIDDLSTAIELDPANPEYRLARALSWSAQGRHRLAMDDYNAAIALRPMDPRLYVARGNEWKKDLKLDNALMDYDVAIRLDPRFVPAYISHALVSRQRRDFARAAAELSALLPLAPDNAEVHRLLARILATCNNDSVRNGPRAVREATTACELTKWGDPDCLDTLAAACAEIGDYDSAVKWQTKAIDLIRKDVPSTLKRAMNFGGRRGVGFEDRLAFYKGKKPTRE